MIKPLLEVKDLSIGFNTENGYFRAVDHISFSILPGETLGIVGESGCGKTLTSLALMRLTQKSAQIETGEIFFKQKDINSLSEAEMRKIRGSALSMIFQNPANSLNPLMTCGDQIGETIKLHQKIKDRQKVKLKTIQLLQKVGIPDPESRIHSYPHQLSGGFKQRIMIAMAICSHPDLLIADEPTTALDVVTQTEILNLLKKIQHESGMSLLLITHDLGVIAKMCQKVLIMCAGQIIEAGGIDDILFHPRHPYTKGLLSAIHESRTA